LAVADYSSQQIEGTVPVECRVSGLWLAGLIVRHWPISDRKARDHQ